MLAERCCFDWNERFERYGGEDEEAAAAEFKPRNNGAYIYTDNIIITTYISGLYFGPIITI